MFGKTWSVNSFGSVVSGDVGFVDVSAQCAADTKALDAI
jgi:hypothetical protein